MLAAKFKAAFRHTMVDLADVQRRIGLAQNDRRGLWNAEIIEADVARLFVSLKFCDLGIDLSFGRAIRRNVVCAVLIVDLIVGLIVGLNVGLNAGLNVGLDAGLDVGLAVGLVV